MKSFKKLETFLLELVKSCIHLFYTNLSNSIMPSPVLESGDTHKVNPIIYHLKEHHGS